MVCGTVCGADAGGTMNELSWEVIADIACATTLTVVWRACKLFAILFVRLGTGQTLGSLTAG